MARPRASRWSPRAVHATRRDDTHPCDLGDTILVCPGFYDEQVVVTRNDLTIKGFGIGQTILQPTAVGVNSTGVGNPFPVAAIVLVSDATGVTVQDLTVDGSLGDDGARNPPCLTVGSGLNVAVGQSVADSEVGGTRLTDRDGPLVRLRSEAAMGP